MAAKNKVLKDRSSRFTADWETLAVLRFGASEPINALVHNESWSGCAVVTLTELQPSSNCICHLGSGSEIEATVVWCKSIDENVWKSGLSFNLPDSAKP